MTTGDIAGELPLARSLRGEIAYCFSTFEQARALGPGGETAVTLDAPQDDADLAVLVRDPAGGVRGRLVPLDGLQGTPGCAYLGDGTLVIVARTNGDTPLRPGRHPDAVDQDVLVVGLDPATLEPRWMLRHGDAGGQAGTRVAATEDGFLLAGTFSSSLNFGLGSMRALSGSDLFVARFRLPIP